MKQLQKKSIAKSESALVQQVIEAVGAFQRQRIGHTPQAVAAALRQSTLVITITDGLTMAEQALAKTAVDIEELQEYHRRRFAYCCDGLRHAIKQITGVEVCEIASKVEVNRGVVVHTLTTSVIEPVSPLEYQTSWDSWSGS